MEKQIKLLKEQHSENLEKAINAYLKKGWKFKGDIVSHNYNLVATIYKN